MMDDTSNFVFNVVPSSFGISNEYWISTALQMCITLHGHDAIN